MPFVTNICHKYLNKAWQIHLIIWTNTLLNLHKYIFLLVIWPCSEKQWSGVGPPVDGRMFAINRPNVLWPTWMDFIGKLSQWWSRGFFHMNRKQRGIIFLSPYHPNNLTQDSFSSTDFGFMKWQNLVNCDEVELGELSTFQKIYDFWDFRICGLRVFGFPMEVFSRFAILGTLGISM